MQEKSGAWPNGQTPLCLQSEESVILIPFFKTFFIYSVQFPASIRQDLQ